MNNTKLYERYHSNRKLQKRIININNFTYSKLLGYVNAYFKKNSVLDIGCGVGTLSFYIASKDKMVTGLDISESAITLAKKNTELFNFKINPKFQAKNFLKIKDDGKYDHILISEVLEHLPDDDLAVKKIHKLLKKGGTVVATSPSINAPLYRMGLLESFDKEVGHLRRYSPDDFVNLFKKNGFNIVKVEKSEGVIRSILFTNHFAEKLIRFIRMPISKLILFADSLTVRLFGESDLIVVAQKR